MRTGKYLFFIFPVQLTTCRIGNLNRLIHKCSLSMVEMRRLTRDGTAETVSRDQIFRREQDREIFIFPVQLTTSRIGNLTRVDPYSCCMCDDMYIHTSSYIRTWLMPSLLNVTTIHTSYYTGFSLSKKKIPWH